MRRFCALLFFAFTCLGHAAPWSDDSHGFQANLPDGPGWQKIDAPSTPEMTVLLALQNTEKGSVFGINALRDIPQNLEDPATQALVETKLKALGYLIVSKSMVSIQGRQWLQVLVRSSQEATTGVMRYTYANGQTYVVSLMRSGGQEPARDPELQAVASSVRVNDISATPVPPSIATTKPAPAPKKKSAVTETVIEERMVLGPISMTREQYRTTLYVTGGAIVLLVLLSLLGGGSKVKKPPGR